MCFFQPSREFNYLFTFKLSFITAEKLLKHCISCATDSNCTLMADSIRVAQPIRLQHLHQYTSGILLMTNNKLTVEDVHRTLCKQKQTPALCASNSKRNTSNRCLDLRCTAYKVRKFQNYQLWVFNIGQVRWRMITEIDDGWSNICIFHVL